MDHRETREFYNLKNATLACFVSRYRRASLCATDVLTKEGSVPFLKTNKQKGQEEKKSSIQVQVFCKGCRLSLMFNNSESAAD